MAPAYSPLIPELYVTDFDASVDFYTGVLGFRIDYDRPEDGFAMIEREGAFIMLDQMRESTPKTGTDRTWLTGAMEKPFGRGINLQIEVSVVDALYASARAAGAQIFLPMEEKWYRAGEIEVGNRQFIVLDPDGYMLRFFQDMGERPYAP